MDLSSDIATRVARLSPPLRAELLRFLSALEKSTPLGQPGDSLIAFAGTLDDQSAQEMARAIEAECEGVDANQW